MSQGYQIYDQHSLYYLTFQIVNWVDVFTRLAYKEIIIDSLNYCRKNKGLELYGYVIMTNHIHLIARSKESNQLSDTIRDFKKFTSKKLIEAIKDHPESRREWLLRKFSYEAQKLRMTTSPRISSSVLTVRPSHS